MLNETDLTKGLYKGSTLKDKDPYNQGRYLVQIPTLQHLMTDDKGIWCKNHIHASRITSSDVGISGSYTPIQAGTKVQVKFAENDMTSGYILKVMSDQAPECLPFKSVDRDDIYLIMRTPKYNHIIAITEDTGDQPANSIQILYSGGSSSIVINSGGIHISSSAAVNITASGEVRIQGSTIQLNSGPAGPPAKITPE